MKRLRRLTVHEINNLFEDVDKTIRQLRRGVGLDLSGGRASGAGEAILALDLVTKQYVDNAIAANSTTVISQASGSVWMYMNQSLAGTVDGANTVFTLPFTPYNSKVAIWLRHVRLQRTVNTPGLREFKLTGATVELGIAPASGDHFVADILVARPTSPVVDEIPTGTKNGTNTAFTLAYLPTAARDVAVYVGGALYKLVDASPAGDEYTLVGQALTLGKAPKASDQFVVDYPVAVPGDIRWQDELEGEKNGSNTVFELDEPPKGTQIGIYLSHVRLKEVANPTLPTEYSITGKTVTVGLAPQAGEPLYAHYVTPSGGDILHAGPGWSVGAEVGDAQATTLADLHVLHPEGLNAFIGGQN